MSDNKRDQRGGHPCRHPGVYSCQCCEILSPKAKSKNRTQRKRALARYEKSANG